MTPPRMIELVFTLEGRPKTKGSFKVTKRGGFLPDNPDSLEWEERVRRKARSAMEKLGAAPTANPVRIDYTFVLPRPASHFGTGRNADQLKASAPVWPASKGRDDLDKLLRAAADGMTDVVYEDDGQIVWVNALKVYDGRRGERGAMIVAVTEFSNVMAVTPVGPVAVA